FRLHGGRGSTVIAPHNQKILRKAFLILTLDMRKAFLTTNNSGADIWKISVAEAGGRRFTMLPPPRV
ncbi:hypothetical protein ACQZ6P_23560, partial [Rhizobium rhizogenes]